jgi:dihydrolipoamide dehydrogenase
MHVVVVGAYGSAGSAVAQRLAEEPNVELTLIDDGEPGGGLCILRGCMPSKEVLSAGAHRYQARHDDRIRSGVPSVDLERVVERKDEHVLGFARHRRSAIHDLAERDDVEFLHDTARFVDDRVLRVGDRTIEAEYVVIATGSTVHLPDLPGLAGDRSRAGTDGLEDPDPRDGVVPMTSDDVLDATDLPDSGIVMGFGYVGLELVPYLAEAGEMDVTVIEHDERPLDEADPDFGAAILELYREHFDVEILTETQERAVERTDDGGVAMQIEREGREERIEAEELFAFTGRVPTLDSLDLSATALEPGPGWVDRRMQAREDERVFVVGDANGHEPILHVAKEQAFQAADNLLAHAAGEPLEPYENTTHHVVFSGLGVYPYARVGHTEATARAVMDDPIVVSRAASDDGVFKTKDVPEGLARLVVDPTDGTVLGYQGLHYHADVMAKTMQVVVECGMDVREIPDRSFHPTTPEILDGLFREASDRLA